MTNHHNAQRSLEARRRKRFLATIEETNPELLALIDAVTKYLESCRINGRHISHQYAYTDAVEVVYAMVSDPKFDPLLLATLAPSA